MRDQYLKDWYTKGFDDGRRVGAIVTFVLIIAIALIAVTVYYTLK